MAYVDGFLLPVPKKNLQAYRQMSRKAGKVWRELGALEYRECVGDDLKIKGTAPFAKATRFGQATQRPPAGARCAVCGSVWSRSSPARATRPA